MQKINFQDLPSTDTPINSTNLNALQSNVEGAMKNTATTSTTDTYCCNYIDGLHSGTVLYNNASGKNDSVPLSESAANFSYLEVYFRSNDGNNNVSSVKVHSPNNKILCLRYELNVGSQMYTKISKATISNSTITISNGIEYYFTLGSNQSMNGSQSSNIYIVKVVGYK